MSSARERLIVALDVPTAVDSRKIVAAVGEYAGYFKIGKQLFTAEGPMLVREMVQAGHKIFLDLKFHDIPNTVASAVTSACALGVSMLTIHASGGSKMMRAAADATAEHAAKSGGQAPLVLAVTVLTSMADSDLQEIGVAGRAVDQVLRLAALARNNGCTGVVASPSEAAEVRRELGTGFAIVTPGVRPAGAAK